MLRLAQLRVPGRGGTLIHHLTSNEHHFLFTGRRSLQARSLSTCWKHFVNLFFSPSKDLAYGISNIATATAVYDTRYRIAHLDCWVRPRVRVGNVTSYTCQTSNNRSNSQGFEC